MAEPVTFVQELPESVPHPARKARNAAPWRAELIARPNEWARILGPWQGSGGVGNYRALYGSLGFEFATRRLTDGVYVFSRYVPRGTGGEGGLPGSGDVST